MSTGSTAPARTPLRFHTRRRILAVLALVLVGCAGVLAVQFVGLRRMGERFRAMEQDEELEVLTREMRDAVRAQYAAQADLVAGGASEPEALAAHDRARGRALETARSLRARAAGETVAPIDEIARAADELDREFHERIVPSVRSGDPSAAAALQRAHRLVGTVDRDVDRILAWLDAQLSKLRRDVAELERSALLGTLGLLVATPILVAGAALYLSRSIARPLARLSEGAAAVRGGRLDTRIRIDTPDEFGALAAEFNAMTAALARDQERLVESEKLASIGRVAAGVAHELNNPLQVMLGYLTLNREVSDPRLREQLAAVEAETLRCRDIVDELLQLSRPTTVSVPVDLREVCDDVVRGLKVAMNGHAGRLSVDGTARAVGDPARLRQVVFNLVKNAIESAGPEGEVTVALRSRDATVEVEVADTGPGVAPETRSRIFEPFFTTKPSGKGLGLAVSRAFALAHGGDIEVRNRTPRGAVFTLGVPRAPEERA